MRSLPALLLLGVAAVAQPVSPVRMGAEWEPAIGTLIRWPLGIPSGLVVELAEDDSLFILVETQAQENQARTTFAAWGVNLDHCRFIRASTYSHWTRDWGPHSVYDGNGEWGITDPVFTGYPWVPGCDGTGRGGIPDSVAVPRRGMRGYEEDDAVNGVLAGDFGCPLHELPAFLTGGNVMVDGHGTAFSTVQMLDENGMWWTEEQFRELAEAYIGAETYHFVSNPDIHGLQHIDCWVKLLDEETLLVKSLPLGHPEYACIEAVVAELETVLSCYGRPYRIARVFCGAYSGNSTAAYTNSLILNRKVLVPLFGIASDGPALEAYRAAMPGYEVIGFTSASWYYYDALHCRTMGILDRHMLRIGHRPYGDGIFEAAAYPIRVLIDDRSESGLLADSLGIRWRVAGAGWSWLSLSPAGVDSFIASIPGQPAGVTVEYFIVAADSSGRRETAPRTAPAGLYRFTVVASLDDVTLTASADSVSLAWSPVPGATSYRVYGSASSYADFQLDPTGSFHDTVWSAPRPSAPRFYRVTAVAP